MQAIRVRFDMSRLVVPGVVALAALIGIAWSMAWTGFLLGLGAAAVLALLVWDIRLLVPLLLLALPFGPKYAMSFGNLYVTTVIVIAASAVWLWRNPFLSRPFTLPKTSILIGLAALFAALGLSAIHGYRHLLANPPNLMRLVQFFLYAWLFVIIIQMRLSREMIRAFLILALLVGVTEGIIGVHEWVTDPGFYLQGTFDFAHNNFAIFVNFMSILLLGVAIAYGWSWLGVAALLGLVPLAVSSIFSFSRGGYVALAVAMPVFLLMPIGRRRKLQLLGAFAALSVFAFFALPADVRMRAQSIVMNVSGQQVGISAANRFKMWRIGLQDFLDSPIVGRGAWTYGLRDNFYMKVLGEAGILGLAAFIGLMYTILREEIRVAMIPMKDPFMRGVCIGLVPATVACLPIYNLTGDYMVVHRFMGTFWIVLALALKYGWSIRPAEIPDG